MWIFGISAPLESESFKTKKEKMFSSLPEKDKESVKRLVYILDRFNISLHGYHELTQINDELPRTHYIEGCQKSISRNFNITPTPGMVPGAEINLVDLLSKETLDPLIETTNLKISADGTNLTRTASLVVCTYGLLNANLRELSSAGNKAIAVIKACENYKTLKFSLKNVIDSVTKIHDDGFFK